MGQYLESRLKATLADHPYVGDIRGRGLFWGVRSPAFCRDMPIPLFQVLTLLLD